MLAMCGLFLELLHYRLAVLGQLFEAEAQAGATLAIPPPIEVVRIVVSLESLGYPIFAELSHGMPSVRGGRRMGASIRVGRP
jgi:hypothetical protein